MEFKPFARRPFIIEAVQVTKDNIEEIAALGVGTVCTSSAGVPFIKVDRNVVPHVSRVYIGFWFTRTDRGQIRCYAKKVFDTQYAELDDAAYFALNPYMRDDKKADDVPEPPPVETASESVNVFDNEQVIVKGGTYTPAVMSLPQQTAKEDRRSV